MSAADWFLSGGQNGCFPGDFADGLHLSASASEFFSDGPAPNIRVTLRTVCTHPHPRVVRALLDRPLSPTTKPMIVAGIVASSPALFWKRETPSHASASADAAAHLVVAVVP